MSNGEKNIFNLADTRYLCRNKSNKKDNGNINNKNDNGNINNKNDNSNSNINDKNIIIKKNKHILCLNIMYFIFIFYYFNSFDFIKN